MDTQEPDNSLAAFIGIKPEPAGFWIRLSAFIIDFICVWIPSFLLTIKLGNETYSFFALFFIPFFYHTLTIGRWGQTLGKFLAGILVITKNGEKISYLKSFGGTLLWYLFILSLLFGFTFNMPSCGAPYPEILIPVFGCLLLGTFLQRKIFFYDYICGTTVVYKKPIGLLRKTAVILPGIAVLIAASYICIYPPSRHPEKSRVAEAMSAISSVKSGQERYLVKHKVYAYKVALLDKDDRGLTVAETHSHFFTMSISTSGCGEHPCYVVTATRHVNNATVAARYGLYSLNAIIPDRPRVQIASCPGGGTNCAELLE
ncbi:MAG: RDD family protein [Elusimicrobia bacterium]|nr:RDD family protein [Elusimicrobiota bacterium]